MNYCIGILNWNRDITNVLNSIKTNDIILCTNSDKYDNSQFKAVLNADKKINVSKNNLIKKARELGYNYVFLIEDDIIIKDNNVFDLYINKMKEYNLGCIYYGFHNDNNRLLQNKPNPSIEIVISNSKREIFTRYTSSAFICINLEINNLLFDENLWLIDLDEYMYRCQQNKLTPFPAGFNIDINDSWNYFEYDKSNKGTERFKSSDLAELDKKLLKEKYKDGFHLESNVDKLLEIIGGMNNIKIK